MVLSKVAYSCIALYQIQLRRIASNTVGLLLYSIEYRCRPILFRQILL